MKINRIAIAAAGTVLLVGGLAAQTQQINGAGATFPNPIYSKWFSRQQTARQRAVNYQPIGSAAASADHRADGVLRRDGRPMTNANCLRRRADPPFPMVRCRGAGKTSPA
jgi:ABC-type phosphate transport system substrate-binding protein